MFPGGLCHVYKLVFSITPSISLQLADAWFTEQQALKWGVSRSVLQEDDSGLWGMDGLDGPDWWGSLLISTDLGFQSRFLLFSISLPPRPNTSALFGNTKNVPSTLRTSLHPVPPPQSSSLLRLSSCLTDSIKKSFEEKDCILFFFPLLQPLQFLAQCLADNNCSVNSKKKKHSWSCIVGMAWRRVGCLSRDKKRAV